MLRPNIKKILCIVSSPEKLQSSSPCNQLFDSPFVPVTILLCYYLFISVFTLLALAASDTQSQGGWNQEGPPPPPSQQVEGLLSHTDRIFIEMFQNHDFKQQTSLKIMLLCQCKVIINNVTFLSFKIIKVTSGLNLKKTIFFTRWRHCPKNS